MEEQKEVWYGIPGHIRQALIGYLGTKPMQEVEQLVAALRNLPVADTSKKSEAPEDE